ncbi:MAG: histidine phosphatase family protein [bacterium]|nr:histidine phosphatase family protein [bacterium]
MTTLYLVRHCEYANPRKILPGRLPVPLSEQGITQAERLRDYFASKKVDAIYSSSVLRCKQTSQAIAGDKVEIIFDKRLLETHSAYQGYWEEDWSHFFAHTDELGGETNQDIQDRIVDFYESLDRSSGKSYIICSHGDPLFFLYQFLDKQPLLGRDELDVMEDYQSKGSVRRVEIFVDGEVKIETVVANEDLVIDDIQDMAYPVYTAE